MKSPRIRTVFGFLLVVSAGFVIVFVTKTQIIPAFEYVLTAVTAALD